MKRSTILAEKIKNYTLLAGSALASSLAAKGQVIYTNVDPDKELGGIVPGSYPYSSYDSIDLNNDGAFDFKITLTDSGTNPDAAGLDFFEKIDGGFDPQHNAIFTYSVEYAPIAFKMECGDSVPLNNQFYGLSYAVFSFQFGTFQANNWNDVHDKYVGVKFDISGQSHYGWIRLDVNTKDTVPNIIVKEYAYEATPGKKIAVCDTGLGVGINEIAHLPEAVTVFPNPSVGNCVIRMDEAWNGEAEISVNDISGKEVFSTNLELNGQKKELPLNFSDLPSGLYFIHLKSASNSATVKWTKL